MKSLKWLIAALLCFGILMIGMTAPGFSREKQETATEQETQTSQETETKQEETTETETDEPIVENTKSAGLRQLLSIGVKNAVKLVGIEDGFYKNDLIKILMPEKLKKIDRLVRQFGGKELSETLIKKMNRAAEKASALALDIFIDAVKKIKFQDVLALLSGKEDAATDFLKRTTSETLKEKFMPIVKNTMEEINALKTYNSYVGKYKNNPFVQALGLDIDIAEYVTDRAIDGLFTMIAKEEKKIREDPAARVTNLLQTVFGKL